MKAKLHKVYILFIVAVTVGLVSLGNIQASRRDADVAAIERLVYQIKETYVARDWEGFAGVFTEDGVWMVRNTLPLVGKEAWWSLMQGSWDQTTVKQMELTNQEIMIAGDWAYIIINEAITSIRNGEARQTYNKNLCILQRQLDDSWKITRLMWNKNPAPLEGLGK